MLQCTVFAQEESAPQIRLSSKGLAYVDLSTSPANPVSGQPTIILLEFLDPQSKAPRADIYYKMIIRNETGPVFVLPGGSTIAGKVGIPYQFDNPGKYQIEIDLNDTDISKSTSTSLDAVTFPLYVMQGQPQETNQTSLNTTSENNPPAVNTETSNTIDWHLLVDGILIVVVGALVAFLIKRRTRSKQTADLSK
ncbi:MAG: hypothetical protein KGI25_00620 [Thaumarchaeota archaeon]|nr:hypothetical protein [Nitrososphaerota archaeon]